jgi:hypothetical protein
MGLITSLTTLLLLPGFALAANFAFTSPTSSTPSLNLSAPIDITWNAGTDGKIYSQVDIKWTAPSPANGGSHTFNLVQNLTITVGNYVWQPSNATAGLLAAQVHLSNGQDFYFTADMHDANSSTGASVTSDKFTVTGYSLIDSYAMATRPAMKWVVSTAVLLGLSFSTL